MSTIESLSTYSVQYPEPNDDNALRYLTFARIRTRDGVEGWGEAITQFPGAAKATQAVCEDLAPLVIGQDVQRNTAIWRDLRSKMWWYGYRGGLASFALSALDIAIWDAKGKELGLSLVELLGGSVVDVLPAVASTHAYRADLAAEVERHAAYIESGDYMGVKIGMGKTGEARLGYEISRDTGFFRSLRAACGDDAWLMMDRGQSLRWTYHDALERVRRFQEDGLMWIEEPFEPWQHDEFRRLRAQTTCMIAGAEREWDVRGYAEAIDAVPLDVVGCDVGRVGGISGALNPDPPWLIREW